MITSEQLDKLWSDPNCSRSTFKYRKNRIIAAIVAAASPLVCSSTYALMCVPSKPAADANPVLGIFDDLVGRVMNTACDLLPWR